MCFVKNDMKKSITLSVILHFSLLYNLIIFQYKTFTTKYISLQYSAYLYTQPEKLITNSWERNSFLSLGPHMCGCPPECIVLNWQYMACGHRELYKKTVKNIWIPYADT